MALQSKGEVILTKYTNSVQILYIDFCITPTTLMHSQFEILIIF